MKDIEIIEDEDADKERGPNWVRVSVTTTSGTFPRRGYLRVPINTAVSVVLTQAAQALGLTDTSTWIALFENRTIDPNLSFAANNLKGRVKLQWGPHEGGGG
jgi:hypothetical protein